jgi:hypothetical protein
VLDHPLGDHWSNVAALSPSGTLLWSDTLTRIDPFAAVLPVSGRTYLTITSDSAMLTERGVRIGQFQLPGTGHDTTSTIFRRLRGDYFLRLRHSNDGFALEIDLLTTGGLPVAHRTLPADSSRRFPFLVQSPRDSSLAVLFSGDHGVRLTLLDRMLGIIVADMQISETGGRVAAPAAVFRGDSLVVVWEDYRSRLPQIYGTALPVPSTSSAWNEKSPSSDAMDLSITPNPARERVTVAYTARADATLEIVDALGRVVARTVSEHAGLSARSWISDLGMLPAGMYTVVLRADGTVKARRLVIAR